MIVTEHGVRLRVFTQVDHAHFAAELGRLWRTGGLAEHPRRDELLLAVREHDNGWQEADSAPSIDSSSGAPLDFLTIPDWHRFEIWQRGARRLRASHPWAALLIGRHALTLLEDAMGEHWDSLFTEIRTFEGESLEALERSAEDLEADYRWLHRLDALSLAACGAWGGSLRRLEIQAAREEGSFSLAPFPLAGRTTFQVPCREIPARPFASANDLAAELATAKWQRLQLQVGPLQG